MNRVTEDLWISDAPTVRKLPETHQFGHVLTLGCFDRLGYERPVASDTTDSARLLYDCVRTRDLIDQK
jgi:hypothetical protein